MLNRLFGRVLPGLGPTGPIGVTVLVPGGLSHRLVDVILGQIPRNLWSFRFGTPVEGTNWHIWHEWHDMPFPVFDQTLVLFSAADYPVSGVAGGCAGTRYSVAVFGGESDEVLGLRCWHELLHGLPGSESADAMLESTAFLEYLQAHYPATYSAFISDLERFRHDPRPQRLFYTMLTNAFARRTGRPLLALPPEPALD